MRQSQSIHPYLESNSLDMPTALSPNKSSAGKAMLALSIDHDVIATKAKCSTRTVRRISANLAAFGTVRHLDIAKWGRLSTLTSEMQEVSIYAC